MCKKLLVLFFSLFIMILYFPKNIKAKKILDLPKEYVQINIGNNSYLEEEGLTYISGTVNWAQEGEYIITYKDNINTTYKKIFIIIDNLKSQYLLDVGEENKLPFDKTNDIVDIFYINDNSYYVISNYQEEDSTEPDQEKLCITYYENNIYKWVYRYYKYSRFVDAYLYNDNLVVTGSIYNENDYYIKTIVLFEITKDRQILKLKEITCEESCFVYSIYIYDNYVYLITSTSGNENDYENYKQDNNHRIVIFKLDYSNFKIIKGYCESSIDQFYVVDTSFYDTRIVINITLKHNFIENNVTYTNCMIEYNDQLQYVNKYYFNIQYKDYIGFQVSKKDLCYFAIDKLNNKKCVSVYYLNDTFNKIIELDLEKEYYINYVEVVTVNKDNIYLCLKYRQNNKYAFLGFAKINSESGNKYFSVTAQETNILNSKIYKGYIVNSYIKNNNFYCNSYNLIEIETNESIIENYTLTQKEVLVNCLDTKQIQYNDTVKNNVYGTYYNEIKFIDHFNNKYSFQDILKIDLVTNITSETIYQTGLILEFNGIGTLNGERINSNYKINDIGKYLLIIEGGNGEKETISFYITDLCYSYIPREKIDLSITNYNVYHNNLTEEFYMYTTSSFLLKSNNSKTIPLALSIISFGVLSFILLRKKI